MILVSGGAGFLGSRLVKGLAEAGHDVRVVTLPGDPGLARLDGVPCEVVEADVTDSAALAGAFDGVDTVYHLTAVIIARNNEVYERVNVGGTRNMVQGALAAGVRHFVYVSSAAAADPESSAYARSKKQGEAIVMGQQGMQYTIIRPTLIYMPGGGQEFNLFVDYLRKWPVIPFIGRGLGRKSPVRAEDVLSGLLAVAGNERSYGKVYNFSGGETVTIRELAELILDLLGERKPIVSIPLPLCRLAALVMETVMENPPLTRYAISRIEAEAALDNSQARQDLGYNPVGVRQGLPLCLGPGVQRP